ncbi:hypothetical protein ACNOHN_17885 [Bacteroides zhangwenhongii]
MKLKTISIAVLAILVMGCNPSSNKSVNNTINSEIKTDSTEYLKPEDLNITEEK